MKTGVAETPQKLRGKKTSQGLFITFEGGEGTGKTSQIARLDKKLTSLGHKVVTTREPGGSKGGEAVRHVLLSGAAEPFGDDMEAILFAAARADHVKTIIEPALKKQQTVISDRFFDSTRVYQSITGNSSDAFVKRLEIIACGDVWPDITLILDLDPQEGMKRAAKRREASQSADRFEKQSISVQKKRRKGFLDIAKSEPERCKVIDASGSEAQVFARIWAEVNPLLESRNTPNKPNLAKPKKPAVKKPAARASKPAVKKVKKLSHKQLTRKQTKVKPSK